jgi:hypothetical protein
MSAPVNLSARAGYNASLAIVGFCAFTMVASTVYFIISAYLAAQTTYPTYSTTVNVTVNGTIKNETVIYYYEPYYHTPTFITHCIYAAVIVFVCALGVVGSMYSKLPRKIQYLFMYAFIMGLMLVLWLMLFSTFYSFWFYYSDLAFSAIAQVVAACLFGVIFSLSFYKIRIMGIEDKQRATTSTL